jgi:hypothetical protein
MITKIKLLKQIGTFINYSGKNIEFSKINFIFGLNTYGKSTICDVFKSLGENNPIYIERRKTIPLDTKEKQKAILVFKKNIDAIEECIHYENGVWSNTQKDISINVFNTEFVFLNIFNGTNLLEERETRENFTDFILGTEGVSLANSLEVKKRSLREMKISIKDNTPDYVKNKSEQDIKEFVNLIIDESIESLDKQIKEILKYKNSIDEQISSRGNILNKKNLITPKTIDIHIIKEA